MDTSSETTPEDSIAVELDQEIESLQAQIAFLNSQRALQVNTILSHNTTQNILSSLRQQSADSLSTTNTSSTSENDPSPLLTTAHTLKTHNLTNLYRLCASITTFTLQDPDPFASSSGSLLALRIDISQTGKFLRPYYIFLNRPYTSSPSHLRIHRHTLPPYIPLASLASRYLPPPFSKLSSLEASNSNVEAGGVGKKQDLPKFIRSLRREITSHHLRISTIKSLRRAFNLDAPDKKQKKRRERDRVINDISIVDAEAKQVRIEWMDGKIGRVVVGRGGEVLKCVVVGEEGRDRETERAVLGGDGRMESVAGRLLEGIY